MSPPVIADLGTISTVAGVAYQVKRLGDEVSDLLKRCERLSKGISDLHEHVEERIRDCQVMDVSSEVYHGLSTLQQQLDEFLVRSQKILKVRKRRMPNMQVLLRRQRDQLFERVTALEAEFNEIFRNFMVDEIAWIGIRQSQQAHLLRELEGKINEILAYVKSGINSSTRHTIQPTLVGTGVGRGHVTNPPTDGAKKSPDTGIRRGISTQSISAMSSGYRSPPPPYTSGTPMNPSLDQIGQDAVLARKPNKLIARRKKTLAREGSQVLRKRPSVSSKSTG